MKLGNALLAVLALLLVAPVMLRAAPTGSQDSAIIDEVKDIYVCPNNNMYLSEADAAGALCPEGTKVMGWVERMVKDGWERQDILNLVNSLKMGKPLVGKTGAPDCSKDGSLKVDAFIMSYCPYGVRYVTDTLIPMVDTLGAAVDYQPYFIMQQDPSGKLKAMHGQTEVDENLRMICLRDKWNKDVWLEYTKCFATDIFGNKQAPKTWQFCAEKAGVNPSELDKCLKEDSAKLAQKDIELSAKYGAYASPTAVYNCGNNIVGAIPFTNVKGQLCRLIPGAKPDACK